MKMTRRTFRIMAVCLACASALFLLYQFTVLSMREFSYLPPFKGRVIKVQEIDHKWNYELHSAAGPDFREHEVSDVPTGNADLAPTLLRLLGMPPAPTMTGRVIEEGLRSGPAIASVRVDRVDEMVRTPDGSYELTAHISIAAGRRYLDSTDVKRPAK